MPSGHRIYNWFTKRKWLRYPLLENKWQNLGDRMAIRIDCIFFSFSSCFTAFLGGGRSLDMWQPPDMALGIKTRGKPPASGKLRTDSGRDDTEIKTNKNHGGCTEWSYVCSFSPQQLSLSHHPLPSAGVLGPQQCRTLCSTNPAGLTSFAMWQCKKD